MRTKRRIAAVAGLTVLLAMVQATPCYADVVSFPDASTSGPMLWVAGFFVVVVSGVSFFLLRRMALRRQAPTDSPAAAAPSAETPEAQHED